MCNSKAKYFPKTCLSCHAMGKMVIGLVTRSIIECSFGQEAYVRLSSAPLGCFGPLSNYVMWVLESECAIGFKLESLTSASLHTIISLIKSTVPEWCFNI